ncbi:protein JOKA2-like isoform X2 [Rutidosis leptorrhynchoides]|uniref:protein JOKA2-like isoform X2 n=1 Tax=Rutidosis leptorrhynchoides TaxID=125765 RepID=UPI003A998AD7
MSSSSIVIKVKYGETLRRFAASVDDKKLALDIAMLREKIRSFFSFGPDVAFTLTYVDEDGDAVTLADDDDLLDVVRQSLNPLRITVTLNSDDFSGSSGNSTPLRSPQVQLPFQYLNAQTAELLKSVPDPYREFLAKLPAELVSKVTSSSTVAEILEKMKVMNLTANASHGVHPNTGGPSNVNPGPSTVKDDKVNLNPEVGSSNLKKKDKHVEKVTESLQQPRGVDLNVPYFEYESFQVPIKDVGEGSSGKNNNTTDGVEKKDDVSSRSSNRPLLRPIGLSALNDQLLSMNQMWKYCQDQVAPQAAATDIKKATNDIDNSSGWSRGMLNPTNECPFSGIPLPTESEPQGYRRHSRGHHWKRYNSFDNSGMDNVFHRGVRCDGCGVHPIMGPRYKSKVKDDYDLCSACFAGAGDVAEYVRIDRPTHGFRHHVPFKGLYDHSLRIPPPTLPHALRAPGSKFHRSKLDSRFILDVNVLDGTIMAPLTPFTKIWRMRNNGSIIWPHGSQLQWIGGDRLSNSHTVDVEIPADGLPVESELEIAVDFTAPELPGRYISYWRMASPAGQKFGQRVWVLIQVDASMNDLGETSINLNLPPVARNNVEVVNHDPLMDNILSENNFIKVTESENTSATDSQPKDQEMNFPINDSLIINNGGVPSTVTSVPPLGPVDTSLMPPPPVVTATPVVQPSGSAVASGSANKEVTDEQEQVLMKDLEDMGFKQPDLNKEVLRRNNYDLEKSIDALCGVSDWDPMLDELQEMGFEDNEANMRLLRKNNGSIKRVVMDLINGEKP